MTEATTPTPSNTTQAPTNPATGDPATPPIITQPTTTQTVPVATPTPATPSTPVTPYAANTGSRQLDVALSHFVGLGLTEDSPEIDQLRKTGNVEYLKGWAVQNGKSVDDLAPFIALAEAGRNELETNKTAADAKIREELSGYVGGEEALKTTLAFVKANSTEEQLEEFGSVLDKGGPVANALLYFFQSKMSADPNVSTVGASAVTPNAGAQPTAVATTYANRDEWKAAQRALISKHGATRYESTPEGRALLAAFPG